MHDHGSTKIQLTYHYQNPLVIRLRVNVRYVIGGVERVRFEASQDLYREAVHLWLATAPAGTTLALGETSLRVRSSLPSAIVIKFPEIRVAPSVYTTPMFILARDWLQAAVADTYVVVPAEFEYDQLNVDDCILKILEGSK
jgi:uncharacterized protein (DUF1330 family)